MKLLFLIILFSLTFNVFCQNQFSIYFESNKFELKKTEIDNLNNWLLMNKEVKIVGINGYCDEDGTFISNDTLAKKRINTVYGFIKNKLKFRADFKSRNFGELHQLSKIKAKNRKVTLFYIEQKDFIRENEILGIKELVPEKVVPVAIKEKKYPEQLIIENPDGTKSEFKLDVDFMKKMANSKAGEKLNVENLNFNFNTFAVTNDSRNKLYELLVVLEQNPNLKIKIQGHICCNPNPKETLSQQRAKAIYGFLVFNKIEKNRLSYEGFGSKFPIYSLPEKSDLERAGNRRVEILVVENSL